MTQQNLLRPVRIRRGSLAGLLAVLGFFSFAQAGPPPTYTTEHAITIDSTVLEPPSWWYVPGITPSIWNSDPESMEAYKTSDKRTLSLKPGKYKFVSFTFDFPFSVNLDGKIEFSQSLDQCVGGRGTQTLVVRCKRTYPHGGQPDYTYQ
ncbi:MAG TPA: hypothetical protein VJ746_03995 [Nitrospira sp.]|nr:hypothetical protein [Nitrospira sp.]